MILIVAVAAWKIQKYFVGKQTSEKSIDNFLGLNPDEVDKITIKTAIDNFIFTKDGDKWFLQESKPRLVDSMAIDNVLSYAIALKVGTVISQNPQRQKDFMVDTVSGNFVQFYKGGRLLSSVIVGKMSPGLTHTYVRKPGSNEVYEAEGIVTYVFGRRRIQWYDRTIFSFNPDNFNSIEFSYPDKAYRLSRDNSQYYISKDLSRNRIPADSTKSATFINQISRLKAVDFANKDDSTKSRFDQVAYSIQINLADNKSYSLQIVGVSPDSSRFYCRLSDRPDISVIYRETFQNLLKDFSSFMP
jgi:hypothetical protein